MPELRRKSQRQADLLIALVEASCPGLTLATPRDAARRGSQVSFRHPQAEPIMQSLIARGVIGDFRTPDILRFGITPLTLRYADLWHAAAAISEDSTARGVAPRPH